MRTRVLSGSRATPFCAKSRYGGVQYDVTNVDDDCINLATSPHPITFHVKNVSAASLSLSRMRADTQTHKIEHRSMYIRTSMFVYVSGLFQN
jgi:hypothetical protein